METQLNTVLDFILIHKISSTVSSSTDTSKLDNKFVLTKKPTPAELVRAFTCWNCLFSEPYKAIQVNLIRSRQMCFTYSMNVNITMTNTQTSCFIIVTIFVFVIVSIVTIKVTDLHTNTRPTLATVFTNRQRLDSAVLCSVDL